MKPTGPHVLYYRSTPESMRFELAVVDAVCVLSLLLPWLNGPFIVHPIVALFLLIASPFFWWMAATIQKDLEKLDGESTTQSGEHPSSN
jgi:hypothetical protein